MRKMNGKPSVGVLENWRSRIIELEKNPWIKKNRKNMCIKLSYPFTERMRKCVKPDTSRRRTGQRHQVATMQGAPSVKYPC